jgi:hypothetical protein
MASVSAYGTASDAAFAEIAVWEVISGDRKAHRRVSSDVPGGLAISGLSALYGIFGSLGCFGSGRKERIGYGAVKAVFQSAWVEAEALEVDLQCVCALHLLPCSAWSPDFSRRGEITASVLSGGGAKALGSYSGRGGATTSRVRVSASKLPSILTRLMATSD